MTKDKMICVGGFMDSSQVDNVGPCLIQVSPDDYRHCFNLPATERVRTAKLIDRYILNNIL